jgi:hypothetical protein
MLRGLACSCVLVGGLGLVSIPLAAQEVVHALTGTVSSISDATKTITVFQDNGSTGVFAQMSSPKTRINFDKRVEAETTAADAFNKQGAYAIVFYFGDGDDRKVVALKSLGEGPFRSTVGTVEKFDGRGHSIAVKDNTGTVQIFKINAGTVAETDFGAAEGTKFQAQKGDHVRVVSSDEGGTPTALFVRDM